MKKILLIMSVLMLVLSGCNDAKPQNQNSGISQDKKDIELDDTIEDILENEKADIDDDMLDALGETVKEVKEDHGEITLSEWVNGPVYKFARSEAWYAFSEYEITENGGYTPKGRCNQIILPLYEIIETPDGNIDTDTLVEVSDTTVSRGYDDMDGMYYYEITHEEYAITVYTDQNGDISGDSSARVKLR